MTQTVIKDPAQLAELLTNLPAGSKIELEKLSTGELAVSHDAPKTKDQIIAEHYAHLRGQPITVTEAAEKYKVVRQSILRWKADGFIEVIEPGYQMTLDEADVAACVHVYRERGGLRGVPLFDEDGYVYQLKHPFLAQKRRKQAQAA